jgi:phosphoribosylanthranilate isomerase
VAAGADAIGLNCFAQSQRYCPLERAGEIVAALPEGVVRVGVFVNAPAEEVASVAAALRLHVVQLHGDEPPDYVRRLRSLAVMKALRAADDFRGVSAYLNECHRLACMPRLVLVDALLPGEYGGTGKTLDWHALRAARHAFGGVPLVLAGGLTPDNVADAIRTVRPWAVDVASGVEECPGKKSAERMRAFVAAARTAFANC